MATRERKSSPSTRATPDSDGWVLLTPNVSQLGHRYLEIMRQMNRATYSPKRPERQVQRMTAPPCEYYYFAGAGFELVIGFKWIERLGHYRIMSTGFVGAIEPEEALDRIAAKARSFTMNRGLDYLVAVRPWQMDNPRIVAMYGLLYRHPTIEIHGGHYVSDGEFLRIRFRG